MQILSLVQPFAVEMMDQLSMLLLVLEQLQIAIDILLVELQLLLLYALDVLVQKLLLVMLAKHQLQ